MNRFISMKYPATLLPILAMGISIASAEEIKCECPGEPDPTTVRSTASVDPETTPTGLVSPAQSARELPAEADAKALASMPHYVANQPDGGYFTTNLIGHDVMNRRDNAIVGKVSEILIDQSGRISALIVGTGGVLGMGEKDLAIAWSQIERVVDGDEVTLSVDLSDDSLDDAPAFARR